MSPDELYDAARDACRWQAGAAEDKGGAVPYVTPFGYVVETPAGVYELRDPDGKRIKPEPVFGA